MKLEEIVAPEWWPEDRPPVKLDDRRIYPAKDGTLRWGTGILVTRAERRQYKLRKVAR